MKVIELEVGQTVIDARGNSYKVEPYDRLISLKEPSKAKRFKQLEQNYGKDFIQSQLEAGKQVEFEHTIDPKIALSIARDHLLESPYYYQALSKMENSLGIS